MPVLESKSVETIEEGKMKKGSGIGDRTVISGSTSSNPCGGDDVDIFSH